MQRNRTKRRNKKALFFWLKKEKPATFRSARNYSSALSPYERLRKTNERSMGIWGVKTGRSRKKSINAIYVMFFFSCNTDQDAHITRSKSVKWRYRTASSAHV